jgi:predicted amidohydrolase YtcJ
MVTMSDLALVNGRVWRAPGAPAAPATAVLVRDNRIALVGSDADVRAAAGAHADVIDLRQGALLPGFTDSHTHFHRTAILREHFLDFDNPAVRSVDDVVDLVRSRAASVASGRWIEGDNLVGGRLAERRLPDRAELDAAAPTHPVLLRGMGKHVVVANSLALKLAGIDAATSDPAGGRIERDGAGVPTGVLHERGKLRLDTTRTDTVVPPMAESDRLAALEAGIAELHRAGVTSIHEITRTRNELADYAHLHADELLHIRVVAYVRIVEGQASLDGMASTGLRSGFGDEMLRLGGVKISIDGACTFRNAAVYDPYLGEPENFGINRVEQPELDDLVRAADAAGFQIAVHAIGPRAVDMALDAFSNIAPDQRVNPLRHRIEHAYLPQRPGQFARMRELGLLLSTQPAFIASVGDAWFEIFPPDEVAQMVPLRSALSAGLTVLANSDCPTAPPTPLTGISAAMTRTTMSGRTLAPEQRVTLAEAIDMYTRAPAFAAREEHCRGQIAPGYLADLVGLATDPREVSADAIGDVAVTLTVVDGVPVHLSDN